MTQTKEQILQVAKDFDDVIETRDIERILPFFANDCSIELFSLTLQGHEGARKWFEWMFQHLAEISFVPTTIMVDGNVFFEEFIVHGKLQDGCKVQSKQAEVLVCENLLLKSLRLYFDRLDFAEAVSSSWLNRKIIQKIIKESTKGLE
ncbi:MAG: nuclear transport factor 2 family protein [Candidatus Hermodarchaeota archaeon]